MKISLGWGGQSTLKNYFSSKSEAFDKTLPEDIKAYGASIGTKLNNVLRIGAQNTNGTKIGNAQSGTEEISAIEQLGFDILGQNESNYDDKLCFWMWNSDYIIIQISSARIPVRRDSDALMRKGYRTSIKVHHGLTWKILWFCIAR